MAKVPAASWVSFMSSSFMFRHSGISLRSPRNDGVVSEPPRRFLDRVFREENLGSVLDDILRPPSLARRLPAVHFHHPHFPHPARARHAEHLAGLVARQMRDHV